MVVAGNQELVPKTLYSTIKGPPPHVRVQVKTSLTVEHASGQVKSWLIVEHASGQDISLLSFAVGHASGQVKTSLPLK